MQEAPEFVPWMNSNEDILMLKSKKYGIVGKKFLNNQSHSWENGSLACDTVVVIIGKVYDLAGGIDRICLYTCYAE